MIGTIVECVKEQSQKEHYLKGDLSVIITGDFNVIGENDEYKNSFVPSLSPMRDAYRTTFPDSKLHPGFTHDPSINSISGGHSGQRLDYIFVDDEIDLAKSKVHVDVVYEEGFENDKGLSDHFLVRLDGVIAENRNENENDGSF